MTERTRPPFRAEHVGSLLRPREVTQARDDFAAGRITARRLRAIEDRAIRAAVRKQEELGLGAVTDGEMRRRSWHMDFFYGIGGLEKVDEKVEVPFHNEGGDFSFSIEGLKIAGKLRLDQTIFGEDFAYLKSVAQGAPKLTIPSPSVMHRRGGRLLDRTANPGVASHLSRYRRVVGRSERGLCRRDRARSASSACTYLQIDDTSWASLCDPEQRAADDRGRQRRRARSPHLYPRHQRRAEAQARRHDGRHPYLPRQLPLVVDRLGRLRLHRRAAVQRSRSTGSSSNMTMRARAGSRRCASCPRARWWCSASSPARRARSSARTI